MASYVAVAFQRDITVVSLPILSVSEGAAFIGDAPEYLAAHLHFRGDGDVIAAGFVEKPALLRYPAGELFGQRIAAVN